MGMCDDIMGHDTTDQDPGAGSAWVSTRLFTCTRHISATES